MLLKNIAEAKAPTYYEASSTAPVRTTLHGTVTADVCIIGGGIAGCSAALHLAERGYSVVLLEARTIGWAASGRNGGQAIVGYACGQQQLIAQVGHEVARQMFDISVEAQQLIRERVERHRIDCDMAWGHLHVAVKARQRMELLEMQQELHDDYAYRAVRFMEPEEVESILATTRYCAGLYDDHSGHLHPLNYTRGLAAAAEAAGTRIFEHSPAERLSETDPQSVFTPQGSVRARFTILCCNAYIGKLTPALGARIMPVGTYVVATERLGAERISTLIRKNIAVSDMNFVIDYFRRSADHRLLFGGRVSYSGRDAFSTARATRRCMLRVFPQLADVEIEYAWGGHVDITMNRAPDFGRLNSSTYYLQGFSGHGVALAGMAGKLVAEAVDGQATRFDLFSRLKHRNFPGGELLRMPALVLAMLYFRLRDLL